MKSASGFNKAGIILYGFLFLFASVLIILPGCGGVAFSDSGGLAENGAFHISVNWPGSMSSKFIPANAQTITVEIIGTGIDNPILSSVNYPETEIVINEIPVGEKVALIKIFDNASNLLAQRKESFVISNGETADSGNVSPGVAVKEAGSAIVFEPAIISLQAGGAAIPFQNWTQSDVTITGLPGGDLSLDSAFINGNIWQFDEGSAGFTSAQMAFLAGQSSICTLNIPGQPVATSPLAGGGAFTTFLKSDGTVWTWGYNQRGQLGDNTDITRLTPVQVKGAEGVGFLTDIVSIASGGQHSVAVKSDGSVWTWGYNDFGQIGDDTVIHRYAPTRVKGPGGVGYLDGVIYAVTRGHYCLALKSDGTVWGWGSNSYGQLGDGTQEQRNTPVQVKGPDGEGYLTGVVSIAGGGNHVLALKNDGSLWCWGYNNAGQVGDGSVITRTTPCRVVGLNGEGYLTDIKAMAAGSNHTVAVKTDGTVWAWGDNAYGQVSDDTITSVNTPIQVKGENGEGFLTDVETVACALYHTVSLKSDGSVWSWGRNYYGQLGDDFVTNRYYPVRMKGEGGVGYLSDITAISVGNHHTVAIDNSGNIWGCGSNGYGQLGINILGGVSHTPVRVIWQ